MEESKALEDFKKLLNDPLARARLMRQAESLGFKDKYNVERASPLRCPACSQYGQSGGSLWINKDEKNKFTCKKCERTFKLEWLDGDLGDLILKLKEAKN